MASSSSLSKKGAAMLAEASAFDNASMSSSNGTGDGVGPSSLAVATSDTETRRRALSRHQKVGEVGDDDDDLFRSSSAPTTGATTATTTGNVTTATTFSSSSVSTSESSSANNAGANTTASSLSLTVTSGTPEAEELLRGGGGTHSSDDGNRNREGEGHQEDGGLEDESVGRAKQQQQQQQQHVVAYRASSASMTEGAAAGYSTGDDDDLDGDGVSTAFTADESWEFTIATSSSQQQQQQRLSSSSLRKGQSAVNASLRRSSSSGKAPPPQSLRSSANKSHRLQQFTVNKLQFHKLGHLYGRDDELSTLQKCWDDISSTNSTSPVAADKAPTSTTHQSGSRRFVTIRGASGTGKSALAESLRPSVLKRGGLYLQGKFPQQLRLSRQSVEPYAAFAAACQELCDVVLSLDDDESTKNGGDNGSTGSSSYQDRFPYRKSFTYSLSDLRRKLDRELGRDAHVLIKVIPGLKQILSAAAPQQQQPVPPSDGGATAEGGDAAATSSTNPSATNNSSDDADEATSFQQAQHQFKFAFRKFVRVLTGFGPVVLVLDDLQWADVASMELVEALLTDREASKIMLIGSYRDDDLYQNMPHLSTIVTLKEHAAGAAASSTGPESGTGAGLHVEEILVGNLDVNQVNELLVDLLSSKRPDTDGLAECVHKKTLGNVFFVIQFLTLLHDSDLLTYNFGVMGWKWDVPTIQLRTAATENVVGLMYAKMKGLPESIGRALPVLACLGSSFTTSVFELVARRFQWKDDLQRNQAEAKSSDSHGDEAATNAITAPNDGDHPESHPEERPIQDPLTAASVLDFCVDQGLIEKAGEEAGAKRYQWVHDKIQEAAFTLVTEAELNSLKLQLGKILFEDFTAKELEKNLFLVVNLLATDSKDDPTSLPRQKPIEMASLYLRAGNKAIEKAAFDQATGYLLAGIGLLPPNHWQDHYQLSLELYSSAAEGFFCTGNFEQMSAHCHEVIRQVDRPILDKRRVYTVLIDATGAAGRQQEALGVCRDVLAKLGHKFPNRAVLLHVLGGIVKIKSTLKKTTSHELVAKLPTMEDPEKLMAMAMFDKSVTWMYNTKSDLLPLAVFKGLKMTMQDGVSVYSPVVFSLVGFLLSGVVFDFKGGAAFGDQAVELLKQARGSRKVESRVQFIVHCFVFCWLRPISLSIKPLLAAYELGMATGDTESGSWCIYFYLEYQFRTGTPLEALIADCAFYAEHVREVKMNNILALLTNLWQTALFLTGANSFDGTFTGELVRQKVALEEAGEFYDYLFIAIHRTLMYTQFVLGKHELVYESIKKTEMDNCGYEKGFPGIAGIYHLYAFNGFSLISLYRETKNKKYLKMAKQFAAKIKTWANGENPNVTHYDSLFDAEFDSLRGATYSAAKQYEVAIVYAGRRGFTQDRALAHELFGEHLARLNPAEHGQDAEFQLNQAIKLYTEWGAHAKVRQMNAKHTKILAPPSEIQIDVGS